MSKLTRVYFPRIREAMDAGIPELYNTVRVAAMDRRNTRQVVESLGFRRTRRILRTLRMLKLPGSREDMAQMYCRLHGVRAHMAASFVRYAGRM